MGFDAEQILRATGVSSPSHLAIVTGAGVSVEHPAHAPNGLGLMEQAVGGYFLPGILEELRAVYRLIQNATDEPDSVFAGRPRLEAILDIVNQAHGEDSLRRLTLNFVNRNPNRVHRMLASHLAAGGRQLTANFDVLVERAGDGGGESLHHFHGSVASTDDALPFGARLSAIEHGFVEEDREALLAPLIDPNTRAIAWIGYSFSDYFDVSPTLIDAIVGGRLDGRSFVWFAYSGDAPRWEQPDAHDKPEVLAAARARGLRVVTIGGRSGDALYDVLASLGCALDPSWAQAAECPGGDRPEVVPLPVDDVARRAATVLLLSRFGLLGRIRRDGAWMGLHISDIPDVERSAYWWKRGRYSTARACALQGLDPHGEHLRVRRHLIDARHAWIRGRLVPAGWSVVSAIRALDSIGSAPPMLTAEALECFGRVAVHMHRAPDTRFFALPLLRASVPDYMRRVAELDGRARDLDGVARTHLRDAIDNFRREVLGERADTLVAVEARASRIRGLAQSESLGAHVDYIRGSANVGQWPFALGPGRTWQERMIELYEAVGNEADVHRLRLLSDRADVPLGVARPFRAAFALDVCGWQRVRMLTMFLLRRRQVRRKVSYTQPRGGDE